ncbi:MAG: hypothetical protein AAF570_22470, partial [Bacteroidota bacterium]
EPFEVGSIEREVCIYGIQNQQNFQFFQSPITHLADTCYTPERQWILTRPNSDHPQATSSIQNEKSGKYMSTAPTLMKGASRKGQQWYFMELSTKPSISGWMTENWDLIANRPLSKICIPGSHDSGTYQETTATVRGGWKNTKTQLYDFQLQLMQGARYFDLRPTLYNAQFYTAHSSKIAGNFFGAVGALLEDIFLQLDAFLSIPGHEKELILLDFHKFSEWARNTNTLNEEKQQNFLDLVNEFIGHRLVQVRAGDQNLADLQVGNLVNANDGNGANRNVVAILPKDFTKLPLPAGFFLKDSTDPKTKLPREDGNLTTFGQYTNTEKVQDLVSMANPRSQLKQLTEQPRENEERPFLFLMSWQLTQTGNTVVFGGDTILELADLCNPALKHYVDTWIASKIINDQCYPNILQTDACDENNTRAVAISLAITKLVNGIT